MKRIFCVKLKCDTGYSFLQYEVVSDTAEQAIKKAKVRAKQETGESYGLVVKLKNRGEAV